MSEYYKCPIPDCASKEVYDYYPTLVLHYGKEHRGSAKLTKDQCIIEEIPQGYILHSNLRKPAPVSTPAGGGAANAPGGSTGATTGDGQGHDIPGSRNVYRQSPEPSNILQRILESYPGLDKAVVAEIMNWVELEGSLHPMQVRHLLTQMAGVPKGAADIIPQKYTLALRKAAAEGEAEVQMTLHTWGAGGFAPRNNPLGVMGMDQGGWPTMNYGYNPGSFGGLPTGARSPFWMGMGGPAGPSETPQESPADIARSKEIEDIKANQSLLNKALETLIQKMTETEEQKKEAAMNARFEKLEGMFAELVTSLSNPPKNDDVKDKAYEALMAEMKETKSEIAKMREETSHNQIKLLEEKVEGLTTELSITMKNRDEEHIKKLESELAEVKEAARKPVTGRTEIDVIADSLKTVGDITKEAGRDIKTFIMSRDTKEKHNPLRVPSGERKTAGERLAAAAEKAATLSEQEMEYVKEA